MKALNWKPVLNGKIYCSPACGAGCTVNAFDEATRNAAALAHRMGKNWKPAVHENMGWFAKATNGIAMVHPPYQRGDEYTAFINGIHQFIGKNMDPKMAFVSALNEMNTYIVKLQRQFAYLEKRS
jgi:hypothetical protein